MTASHYDAELAQLPRTYAVALQASVDRLQTAIAAAAETSLIGVGSGGSYTVASLICSLHEKYTGRVSRPSTPLELICNPTLAASSPVFLVSAEGKNPDIVEALERARRYSSRSIHVLTNRQQCPLMEHVQELPEVTSHVFELETKDGYLATNSLLLDAVLIARAYSALDGSPDQLPDTLDALRIGNSSVGAWLEESAGFAQEAVRGGSVLVIFSPLLRPVAADLESKLAESALLHCQLADLRSFAHGRHLWLEQRPEDCAVLALVDPGVEALWDGMCKLLPANVPVCTMRLPGSGPRDLIAGLVAQMHLVAQMAQQAKLDPAKPKVASFGRDLYYLDLPSFIPRPLPSGTRGEQSKNEVLGARWPSGRTIGGMRRAADAFESSLVQQSFRAIVFDYDGTLCRSQTRDMPPSPPVVREVVRLLEAGIVVGIASGRGNSIHADLRSALPAHLWPLVQLGLYNGGWIGSLADDIAVEPVSNEFLSHVQRLMHRLVDHGVPIEQVRSTPPYQVSIRFRDGVDADGMWFVVADALRQAGLDLSTIVRSKHSVDVLAVAVNKSHLVANIVQHRRVDPYEVITMGDQGAWPGNDASLLEHRFSLSVDQPSRRLDRGWKLAPHHLRDVDAALWYLRHAQVDAKERRFRFAFQERGEEAGA